MSVRGILERERVRVDAEWSDEAPGPEWEGFDGTSWRVTIRHGRRSFVVPFHQGSAHLGPPEPASVLECIALDWSGWRAAQGFEDWAAEYGYDVDSRRGERTWRAVERQSLAAERVLGVELLEAIGGES